LGVKVGADGWAHDVKVKKSVGYGLDEKAVEVVKRWRFRPATMNGHSVAVQVDLEVNFRRV
jgi:TonB family protein